VSKLNDELIPLIADTAYGNDEAFGKLYQLTSSRLFALCIQVVKRRDWAEEILQEAFVKIWHHASDYHKGKGSVFNWMVSIVRYRAIDHLRRHDNQLELAGSSEDLNRLHRQEYVDAKLNSDVLALDKCMQQLSNEQRQSIMMAFFHGLSHDDLAAHLSKPLGTIKSWVRRGLNSLKRCLDL